MKDKDPQKAVSEKLAEINQDNQGLIELNSDQKDLQLKFNLRDKKVKLFNKNKGNISINIPKEQFDSVDVVDNKIVYSGKNSKVDVIIEAVGGGIKQAINIKSKDAPSFYDFDVELIRGDKLERMEDGSAMITSNNSDSQKLDLSKLPTQIDKKTIELIKSGRKVKALIAKPWAVDANKKELKTWYTVEKGNTLRQNIDLKDVTFPVIADPLWCGDVASYVGWNWRTYYNSGAWSLTIKPTWCGINMSGPTPWGSWQEVYNKTPYHSAWPYPQAYGTNTYWSMYNQYVCHTDWKAFNYLWDRKNPWDGSLEYNLEPWRADKGYWGFFDSKCN